MMVKYHKKGGDLDGQIQVSDKNHIWIEPVSNITD